MPLVYLFAEKFAMGISGSLRYIVVPLWSGERLREVLDHVVPGRSSPPWTCRARTRPARRSLSENTGQVPRFGDGRLGSEAGSGGTAEVLPHGLTRLWLRWAVSVPGSAHRCAQASFRWCSACKGRVFAFG